MGRLLFVFVMVSLALSLFAPAAQADLSVTYSDDAGHHAAATVTVGTNALTVSLSNTADFPTPDPALAISGFFFDWLNATGDAPGPALTFESATGPLATYDKRTGELTSLDATGDLSQLWGFRQGMTGPEPFFNFGIAASGLSGLTPYNINDPFAGSVSDGEPPLAGPDGLIVAPFDTVGSGLRPANDQPLVRGGPATFVFSFTGTGTTGNRAVFTYGTGPEFVTPLPGAVLLGVLGLAFAGMKLRKKV